MKVLWLANSPSNYRPEFSPGGYNGVGWISSAENYISNIQSVDLAICFLMSGQPFKVKQYNTTYYPIPNPVRNSLFRRFEKLFRYAFNLSINQFEEKSELFIKDYLKKIIKDFGPDVIHVWGSESYMGLISEVTSIPVILHIQGILNPCMNAFLPPSISWGEWVYMDKNPYSILQRKMIKNIWKVNAEREKRILKGTKYLMGRTEWDYRIAKIYAPDATYFHSGELLRDVFYKNTGRLFPDKLTIVSIISSPPYKGYDMILKTAAILKNELKQEFEWKCYGDISPEFIEKQIGIKHTEVNIELKGVATAEQLCECLRQSVVYFHPSYIDNSPNSVCEAQLLGIPVVATNVGGVSSIVNDGISGYLVPANDPFQAAYYINELLINRDKNVAFGCEGEKIAVARHDKENIVKELLDNYMRVIKQ